MKKLLSLRQGASVTTPHGVGTIAHFEVYPPLKGTLGRERKSWAGPDLVPEFPFKAVDGSFIRIGVAGCHPTLDIAYYTVNELTP